MNVKLVVAYDGTGFHGLRSTTAYAPLPGPHQGDLDRRSPPGDASPALGAPTPAFIWGQVISVELPDGVGLADLARRLNSLCPGDRRAIDRAGGGRLRRPLLGAVAALPLRRVERGHPNPLLANRAWHVAGPLDLAAMDEAAQHLPRARLRRRSAADRRSRSASPSRPSCGTSWNSACPTSPGATTARSTEPTSTDSVQPAPQNETLLRFEVRANAFCHQMGLSIVGTLVEVGGGSSLRSTSRRSSPPAIAGRPARWLRRTV